MLQWFMAKVKVSDSKGPTRLERNPERSLAQQ
jgi:hypothetical protein